MLVVFPFEVDFYQSHQVPVEYVGHPLLDELKPELMDADFNLKRRGRLGITGAQKVLGLMPGSRKQEIERHLQVQLAVAQQLVKKHDNLKVLLLVAPTLSKDYIQEQLEDLKFPVTVVQDEPFNMISLTDAVLAASGTATLMVGLLEKPMVIMYKVSWLSAFIGRRLVKGFFGLVNLLSKKEIVPEIFQERATPEVLTPLVESALYDQSVRAQMVADLQALKTTLGTKGVTPRVAAAIEEFLVAPAQGR
jgi:lipid-A-disaccharide synthase